MRLIESHPELDPTAHILMRGVAIACAVGVLGWVVWPSPESGYVAQHETISNTTAERGSDHQTTDELNPASFTTTTLWYPPTPKPSASRTEPVAASIRFELLAITATSDFDGRRVFSAMLYDPEDDLVRAMRVNDELHGYLVSEISPSGIILSGARQATIRLVLDDEGAG